MIVEILAKELVKYGGNSRSFGAGPTDRIYRL